MRLELVRAVLAAATAAALAVPAAAAGPGAAPSGPDVTIVGPLENGAVKISGTATVNGDVAATQAGPWSVGQSGPWSVGLEGPASTALLNIDAATAGLRYDTEGNLKVSVGPGGASDPSVASRSPFGFSAHSSFNDSVTIPGSLANVTSYSFHSDRDMIAIFMRDGSPAFGLRVAANQSVVGSFHHAIPADALQLQCVGGGACTALVSAAGY